MRGLNLLLRRPPDACFAAQLHGTHLLSRFRILQCSESIGVSAVPLALLPEWTYPKRALFLPVKSSEVPKAT